MVFCSSRYGIQVEPWSVQIIISMHASFQTLHHAGEFGIVHKAKLSSGSVSFNETVAVKTLKGNTHTFQIRLKIILCYILIRCV